MFRVKTIINDVCDLEIDETFNTEKEAVAYIRGCIKVLSNHNITSNPEGFGISKDVFAITINVRKAPETLVYTFYKVKE